MKKIVLLRHGESAWNKENRFTGWTDVDLTEKGVAEAEKAGVTLREYGFNFDKAYTSYLKRAVKTLNCVLDKMNLDWIPVEKSWRLNEKHYGDLQGLNKAETAEKYGEEQVLIWRRSYSSQSAFRKRFEKSAFRLSLSRSIRCGTAAYRIIKRYHRPYYAALGVGYIPGFKRCAYLAGCRAWQ